MRVRFDFDDFFLDSVWQDIPFRLNEGDIVSGKLFTIGSPNPNPLFDNDFKVNFCCIDIDDIGHYQEIHLEIWD